MSLTRAHALLVLAACLLVSPAMAASLPRGMQRAVTAAVRSMADELHHVAPARIERMDFGQKPLIEWLGNGRDGSRSVRIISNGLARRYRVTVTADGTAALQPLSEWAPRPYRLGTALLREKAKRLAAELFRSRAAEGKTPLQYPRIRLHSVLGDDGTTRLDLVVSAAHSDGSGRVVHVPRFARTIEIDRHGETRSTSAWDEVTAPR